MSRWLAKRPITIALGRREAAFACPGAPVQCIELPAAAGELSMDLPAERVEALRAWLDERVAAVGAAHRPRQLVCTGELSRIWTLRLPSGLTSRRELQDVARARCIQTFGPPARSWQIGADWRVADSLPCWAIPAWVETLSDGRRRLAPRVLLAQVLAAVRSELPRSGWAVLLLPQSAAILRLERGIARQIRTLALDAGDADAAVLIAAALSRECLRAGETPGPDVPWVDARRLDAAAHTDAALAVSLASDADAASFGTPVLRRSRTEVVLGTGSGPLQRAAAGIAVAIATGAVAWAGIDAVRETRTMQAASARLETVRARAVPPPASSAPVSALTVAQRTRLNFAIRHLNTPWGEVLDSLEAGTPDGVVITAIESSGDRATVRLQVNGADMDTLLRYADTMAATPAFARADLVQQEAGSGTTPVRLSFELALRRSQEALR